MSRERFTPGPKCQGGNDGLYCQQIGFCQAAKVIRQEINYAQAGDKGGLQQAIDRTTCDHPDVKAATEAARNLLP